MRSAIAAVPSIGRAVHVERAARDADATQDLYERYSGQIYGYCVNQLGSRDEADDALQSTFLNAHRALQRGVTPEAEAAWLFKIAHNVCLTRRRSTRRRGRVESPSDFAAVQDVLPAPSRESPDDLIRLTDALEHMPDTQRRAILLREWQGLSYHEIAAELELSQSAVETLIFRARRTLATNLEAESGQPSTLARMRKALDVGALLAMVKGLFEGGAAVKVAAVAIAASGAAVAATDPPAPPAVTSVAQVATARTTEAPVQFEHTRPVEAKLGGGRAVPTKSTHVAAAPAASKAQGPATSALAAHSKAAAAAPQKPDKHKAKDEPKAIPPGHAKNPAATAHPQTAPAKAVAPMPESLVAAHAPVEETHAAEPSDKGQGIEHGNDKGSKK